MQHIMYFDGGVVKMIKYGVMMHLPDGKLPGFYSQIVKALANNTQLFDRDHELLILSSEAEQEQAAQVLEQYKIDYEHMTLLLLPRNASLSPAADDYGFASRAEHHYLYADLVSVYRFAHELPVDAEKEQALLQMGEHHIARFTDAGVHQYVVDKQLRSLIDGIAKAYRCRVEFMI